MAASVARTRSRYAPGPAPARSTCRRSTTPHTGWPRGSSPATPEHATRRPPTRWSPTQPAAACNPSAKSVQVDAAASITQARTGEYARRIHLRRQTAKFIAVYFSRLVSYRLATTAAGIPGDRVVTGQRAFRSKTLWHVQDLRGSASPPARRPDSTIRVATVPAGHWRRGFAACGSPGPARSPRFPSDAGSHAPSWGH